MTEWKTRIGYLPQNLVDEAVHVVIDQVPDENVQYQVMRLVEQAYGEGYQAGFMRSHREDSWRQHRAAEEAKKSMKEPQS